MGVCGMFVYDQKGPGCTYAQLSTPLLDVDRRNDALEEWVERRLSQTLGLRKSTTDGYNIFGVGICILFITLHLLLNPL